MTRGTGELDASLKERVQLVPESFGAAGPSGAYEYFALSADTTNIADVAIVEPTPGTVRVVVLTKTDMSGPPLAAVLGLVENALTPDEVRPLSDTVEVVAATTLERKVKVRFWTFPGAVASLAQAAMEPVVEEYLARREIGRDLMLSKLVALAHVEGVHSAEVTILLTDDTPTVGDLLVDDEHWVKVTSVIFEAAGVRS